MAFHGGTRIDCVSGSGVKGAFFSFFNHYFFMSCEVTVGDTGASSLPCP